MNAVARGAAKGRYGLIAVAADFCNNGWPDIYVACASTPSCCFATNHGRHVCPRTPEAWGRLEPQLGGKSDFQHSRPSDSTAQRRVGSRSAGSCRATRHHSGRRWRDQTRRPRVHHESVGDDRHGQPGGQKMLRRRQSSTAQSCLISPNCGMCVSTSVV
jgi:hypothetical protein